MACYEDLRQAFVATAKERDELNKLLAQVRAERDAVTRRMIQLEKENAALLEIVKNSTDCQYCKHNGTECPGSDDCFMGETCSSCELPKIPCCTCGQNNQWEWVGI